MIVIFDSHQTISWIQSDEIPLSSNQDLDPEGTYKSEVQFDIWKMLCTFSFGCFQIYQDKNAQQLIF